MRLHLPTPLRRALLAAVVTVSSLASAASATEIATLDLSNERPDDFFTGVETATLTGNPTLTGCTGSITGAGLSTGSFIAAGAIQTGTTETAADGSVTAFQSIFLGRQTLVSDMVFYGDLLVNDGGSVTAEYAGNVHVSGDLGAQTGAAATVADSMTLALDGQLLLNQGSLKVLGGDSALVLLQEQTLTDTDVTVQGTVSGLSWESTGGMTLLSGPYAELLMGEGDIRLSGINRMEGGALIETTEGDVEMRGLNSLMDSQVQSSGNIHIVSDVNEEPASLTSIRNSVVQADGAVLIAGEEGNLATITGDCMITSAGTETVTTDSGELREVGMVLRNVQAQDLYGDTDLQAMDADILLQRDVTLEDTTLATAAETGERGQIVLDREATLTLREGAELDGELASVDTTAAIRLLDATNLTRSFDDTDYNGRILADAGDGSQVTVEGAGFGTEARTMLKDTNFTVDAAAYAAAPMVQVGSLDATQDTGNRNTEAGDLNSFLIDGSYTADDNTRLGYTDIGSILNFDRGTAGTETNATSLALSPYTLLWEDIALNPDGSVTADKLTLSGEAEANGARVFATLGDTEPAEDAIADGTRALFAEGTIDPDAGFAEDVLYDVAQTANGTYQRRLRTLNVHVDNEDENGAALVFSKNFRSAAVTGNQSAVAEVLSALADTVDHTEGTLAASDSEMMHLLDALDYTRSAGAASAALQSLSGVGNTVVQHAALDASSHHLDTLRSRIVMPTPCTWDKGGYHMPERLSDAWIVYEGGYDHIGSQANMGAYNRTFQGLLLGYDRQLCCNATLGIAFGYEDSISRSSGTRADNETYFLDLYSGVRTGKFDHKFSVGLGWHNFDTKRHVSVSAPGHDFDSDLTGSADGLAFNVGYELSYEYRLSDTAVFTPYLDVNYAYINLDNLKEGGAAALTTDFDNMNLVQVALGARMDRHFAGLQHQERGTVTFSAQAVGEFSERRPGATCRFLDSEFGSFGVNSLKRAPFYGQIGMDVVLPLSAHWDMIGGAYGRLGHDRGSVAGNVGLRYDF